MMMKQHLATIILVSLLSLSLAIEHVPILKRFEVPHSPSPATDDFLALDDPLMANTRWGQVRGMYDSRNRARMWRAVPYATPPVDHLRWTNAQEPVEWSGVRDGTKQPPGCIQQCEEPPLACPPVMSEDCLYLNVYAPAIPPATLMPVMMFMHGGNFRDGFAGTPLYDGSFMANSTETVIVVINYRLGVLGFLASADDNIQGNYGLTDQRMAMLWIQQNILAFGGDPSRVTLFGQSAGAVSTAIHMYAPGSAGLFQQALMESEPYGIPLRTSEDMYKAEVAFANFTGCASGDVTCYAKLDSAQLLAAQVQLYKDTKVDAKFLQAFMPMTPIVDGHQVPLGPYEAFTAGITRPMPMVQGNTRQEGFLFVYEGFNQSITQTYFNFAILLVFDVAHYKAIEAQYPIPAWQDNDARPLMSDITTDAIFECVNRNVSIKRYNQVDNPHPTFYYIYDHPPSFANRVFNVEACWNVSCHGSELPFVFHAADGISFNGTFWNMTSEEYALSEGITQYWTNFAHTGDPSVPSGRGWLGKQKVPVQWPKYDPTNEVSVRITAPAFTVDKMYDRSICDFWDTQGYTWENNNNAAAVVSHRDIMNMKMKLGL